jgi:hypothetical protein
MCCGVSKDRISGLIFFKDTILFYEKIEHILCPYRVAYRWRTLVCILPTRLHYCSYSKYSHGHWRQFVRDRFICSGLWPAQFPKLNLSDRGNKTAKRLHMKPHCNWKTEGKQEGKFTLYPKKHLNAEQPENSHHLLLS